MADSVSWDFSEMHKLSADLGVVGEEAGENVIKAIGVSSNKTKKAWQEPLKGSAHLPGLPYAIDYEITSDGRTVTSDIGFNKGRAQGALGNVSEYGTPTVTGRGYGIEALNANQADFQHGLEVALEQAERGVGL